VSSLNLFLERKEKRIVFLAFSRVFTSHAHNHSHSIAQAHLDREGNFVIFLQLLSSFEEGRIVFVFFFRRQMVSEFNILQMFSVFIVPYEFTEDRE
jgi:hypothetical protein